MKRIRELPAPVLFPDPFAIVNSPVLLPVDIPKKCTSSALGNQRSPLANLPKTAGAKGDYGDDVAFNPRKFPIYRARGLRLPMLHVPAGLIRGAELIEHLLILRIDIYTAIVGAGKRWRVNVVDVDGH